MLREARVGGGGGGGGGGEGLKAFIDLIIFTHGSLSSKPRSSKAPCNFIKEFNFGI